MKEILNQIIENKKSMNNQPIFIPTNQNNQVDWKEKFEYIERNHGWIPEHKQRIIDFIEQTIHQETTKAVDKRVEEIREGFWNEFLHAGELWFDYFIETKEDEEDANEKVKDHWNSIIEYSAKPTNNTKEELSNNK